MYIFIIEIKTNVVTVVYCSKKSEKKLKGESEAVTARRSNIDL